jgi:hypothetical protein
MKLDLVSPTMGANCRGLCLDLRVGVLTDVMNNGTRGSRGFIEVQASRSIIALCPMCVGCIMIAWVETPSTTPFIDYGGRVYMEDLVS